MRFVKIVIINSAKKYIIIKYFIFLGNIAFLNLKKLILLDE